MWEPLQADGLLFDQVLAHIERAGEQDDAALDQIDQVLRYGSHVQADEDQAEQEHADDDAADLADAADERDAADNAGVLKIFYQNPLVLNRL